MVGNEGEVGIGPYGKDAFFVVGYWDSRKIERVFGCLCFVSRCD